MRFDHTDLIPLCFAILTLVAAGDEARCQVPRGRFTNVVKLGPNVNAEGAEDTLQAISADGLAIFFTSFRDSGYGDADLYQATRTSINEPFGPAMNLGPEINTSERDNFPSISADGRTLYFASKRSEGMGDFDLYQATRPTVHDAFGNVMNLGPGVNTTSIERGPHIAPDGLTLYLTSNRLDSKGGDDIFVATRDNVSEPFGNVTNLGDGINSPYGEFVPSVSLNGLVMFFSDFWRPPFRPGGKGDSDIWVALRETTDAPFGDVVNLNDFSLGSNVNREFRENAPTISHDWPASSSKLYFSSRPDGDLDIWQATWVPETLGDFDGYGQLDAADLDRLISVIADATHDVRVDVTDDNLVDEEDLDAWVKDLRKTWFGDANLDGQFDSADLVQVFQAGEYEDGVVENSTWATGDWNADLDFSSGDLVVAFQDGGFESGPRDPTKVVPEPGGMLTVAIGMIGLWVVPRTRRTAV